MGIGSTNATGAGRLRGRHIVVSHSAGASAMVDHGVVTLGDGNAYRLLEIKSSGALTFNAAQLARGFTADICIVQGGQGGGRGNYDRGGFGGKLLNFYGLKMLDLSVVIGAGGSGATVGSALGGDGGASSIQRAIDPAAFEASGCGTGAGAGGGNTASATNGDGLAKYPFGDAAYFSIHCGGGGGGGSSGSNTSGGSGGTNGGSGAARTSGGNAGGAAGDGSAGAGSGAGSTAGGDAAYYGGGGGGGFHAATSAGYTGGGNGFQGVVWLRIPA